MFRKTLNPKKLSLLLLLAGALISCNRTGQKEEVSVDDFEVETNIFDDINTAKKIFYSLPSPLETATLIKSAGAEYNEELLNKTANADNYTTIKKRALNLGIYTTDLSYASLFEQSQTSLNYMNASKKMAWKE